MKSQSAKEDVFLVNSDLTKEKFVWKPGSGVSNDQIRPSPRTRALRNQYLKWKDTLGYEKALYWTEVFKENEGEPVIIKRAKAFKKFLENNTLCIQPYELIVGVVEKQPRVPVINPDISCDWIEEEMDTFSTRPNSPVQVDEETRRMLKEIVFPYWRGKTLRDAWFKSIEHVAPELIKLGFKTGIIDPTITFTYGLSHVTIGFPKLLKKGINGIRKEVEDKLKTLGRSSDPGYFKKVIFYKALLIVCEATAKWGKRHAELARQLAERETDPHRKEDYMKVAEVCDWVPANPARNFHEAVQMVWFGLLFTNDPSFGNGLGRIDQYLYPYYKRDIEEGRITKDYAQELLDCLWIKTSELQYIHTAQEAKYFTGMGAGTCPCLGGIDENGLDATNELSYMMVQATMNTRLRQPNLAVLWHPNMPEDFVLKVCQLISLGSGHPSNFNMDLLVEMLQEMGVPLREARRGTFFGCVEPSGPEGTTQTNSNFGVLNLGVAMEFALNKGVWRLNGEQLGYPTGDPRGFTSFDDVKKAYRKQIEYLVNCHVTMAQIAESLQQEMDPVPFEDLVMDDCIQNAVDFHAGGARYNLGPAILPTGVADVINSLAAVKHLIFDEKKLTWDELLDALETDFEGPRGEEIRQMCLAAPKYGNDDPYVDSIATWSMNIIAEEVGKHISQVGIKWKVGIIPLIANVPFGLVAGALPEGRKAGTPLAEGCSPKQGTDVKGPTADILSVTNIDHSAFLDGTQYNVRLSPATLKDRSGLRNLAALIKTFMSRGGNHVQFNVISSNLLRDAQKHPENYKGLLVRVAGYSAFFTELDISVQNDIISRTEHGL